jgi:hypothetical protein
MSKNSIIAVVVVAALAAGTVLVAGYVDGPSQSAKVTADSACGGCPKAGTPECPKAGAEDCPLAGTPDCPKASAACEKKAEACPTAAQQSTCETTPAAGGCPREAQPVSCPMMGGEAPAQSPCGSSQAGGCPHAE